MRSSYEIYLCIDSFTALSGSAREILEPTSLMLNAIKLWNIFMHWFIFCCIWKCWWNFGAQEPQCNRSSDVECGQATQYIYAMIHLPLYLEVLVKFWSLRISMQSIFRCWMLWSGYQRMYLCNDSSVAIRKCSWNFEAYESQCNLSSDVECDQATKYVYAIIFPPLHLEVLVKF